MLLDAFGYIFKDFRTGVPSFTWLFISKAGIACLGRMVPRCPTPAARRGHQPQYRVSRVAFRINEDQRRPVAYAAAVKLFVALPGRAAAARGATPLAQCVHDAKASASSF